MKTTIIFNCLLVVMCLAACVEAASSSLAGKSDAKITTVAQRSVDSQNSDGVRSHRLDEPGAGESCANPIILPPVMHYEYIANTCSAYDLISYMGTCGGGNPSGLDVIYRFTLPTPGTVTLRDSFLTYDQDVQITIFTDCEDPIGTCVTSVDNWPAAFEENIINLSLPANTYYVATSLSGEACGEIYFEITSDVILQAVPQPGESCANPIVIPAVTHYEHVANTCSAANSVPNIGSCGAGNASGPDIIYQFTLLTAGTVTMRDSFQTFDQDVQLMVFTNCADPMGSCVASVDNWPAAFEENIINLTLPANTYYVATSVAGSACGDVYFEISSDVTLPVQLISAVAIPGDRSVTLNWATASETHNDWFEILRNGRKIDDVPSKGNDASGHDYSWTDNGLTNNTGYEYSLRAIGFNGSVSILATLHAVPNSNLGTVTAYDLQQNYPNPFNPLTRINFDLREAGFVSLKVYNVAGQEVSTLVNGQMTAGSHTATLHATDLPSGLYFYRITANEFVAEKKMLLLK